MLLASSNSCIPHLNIAKPLLQSKDSYLQRQSKRPDALEKQAEVSAS